MDYSKLLSEMNQEKRMREKFSTIHSIFPTHSLSEEVKKWHGEGKNSDEPAGCNAPALPVSSSSHRLYIP